MLMLSSIRYSLVRRSAESHLMARLSAIVTSASFLSSGSSSLASSDSESEELSPSCRLFLWELGVLFSRFRLVPDWSLWLALVIVS